MTCNGPRHLADLLPGDIGHVVAVGHRDHDVVLAARKHEDHVPFLDPRLDLLVGVLLVVVVARDDVVQDLHGHAAEGNGNDGPTHGLGTSNGLQHPGRTLDGRIEEHVGRVDDWAVFALAVEVDRQFARRIGSLVLGDTSLAHGDVGRQTNAVFNRCVDVLDVLGDLREGALGLAGGQHPIDTLFDALDVVVLHEGDLAASVPELFEPLGILARSIATQRIVDAADRLQR